MAPTHLASRSARWSNRAADRSHVQNSDREIVLNAKYERIKPTAGFIAVSSALGLGGWTSFSGLMAEAWPELYATYYSDRRLSRPFAVQSKPEKSHGKMGGLAKDQLSHGRWTYRPWTILRQSHQHPEIPLIWNESTRIIAMIGRSILVGAR